MSNPQVIEHEFHSNTDICYSYLPFIKDFGIFLTISGNFNLKDDVILKLKLPDEDSYEQVNAKIIWITPENAINHVHAGIGVQLVGDNAANVKQKILKHIDNISDVAGYVYGLNL